MDNVIAKQDGNTQARFLHRHSLQTVAFLYVAHEIKRSDSRWYFMAIFNEIIIIAIIAIIILIELHDFLL